MNRHEIISPDREDLISEKLKKAKVYLAPMAGISDMPFRKICFENACDSATSEMISAKALLYDSLKSKKLMDKDPDEGDLVIQLFGHDPDDLARAIGKYINNDERFSAVELNLGCPATKIVKNKEGSALMRDPALIEKILKKMILVSEKPVFIKMRTGWDQDEENFLEIGMMAEALGVSRVTLHARTREMGYSGRADWSKIKLLKTSLNIPVIANGDVKSPEDFAKVIEETGADGAAIGRGAIGRPYIFRQIKDYIKSGSYEDMNKDKILDFLLLHYKRELDYRGEIRGLLEMRKNISFYLSGMQGGAKIKQALLKEEKPANVFKIIDEFR